MTPEDVGRPMRGAPLAIVFACLLVLPAAAAIAGQTVGAGIVRYTYARGVAYECDAELAVDIHTSSVDPANSDIRIYVTPTVEGVPAGIGANLVQLIACALPEIQFDWTNIPGHRASGWRSSSIQSCNELTLRIDPLAPLSKVVFSRYNACIGQSESWSGTAVWSP